jgi:hypothetical protein
LPWIATINRLGFYMDLLDTTELYSRLKNYLQELIHPIYFKLTWDDAPSDSWLEKFYLTILVDFF